VLLRQLRRRLQVAATDVVISCCDENSICRWNTYRLCRFWFQRCQWRKSRLPYNLYWVGGDV